MEETCNPGLQGCNQDILLRVARLLPPSAKLAFRLSCRQAWHAVNASIQSLCLPVNWQASRRTAVDLAKFSGLERLSFTGYGSIFSVVPAGLMSFMDLVAGGQSLRGIKVIDFTAIAASPSDLHSLQALPLLSTLVVGRLQSLSGLCEATQDPLSSYTTQDLDSCTSQQAQDLPSYTALQALLAISCCTSLTALTLHSGQPPAAALTFLSRLSRLRALDLDCSPGHLTTAIVEAVAGCSASLESLLVGGHCQHGCRLDALRALRGLRLLGATITDAEGCATEQTLASLTALPSLTDLRICCQLPLPVLQHLQCLRTFMGPLVPIFQAQWDALSLLPNLHELTVSSIRVPALFPASSTSLTRLSVSSQRLAQQPEAEQGWLCCPLGVLCPRLITLQLTMYSTDVLSLLDLPQPAGLQRLSLQAQGLSPLQLAGPGPGAAATAATAGCPLDCLVGLRQLTLLALHDSAGLLLRGGGSIGGGGGDDDEVVRLFSNLPGLRALRLDSCGSMSDQACGSLTDSCDSCVSLSDQACGSLSDSCDSCDSLHVAPCCLTHGMIDSCGHSADSCDSCGSLTDSCDSCGSLTDSCDSCGSLTDSCDSCGSLTNSCDSCSCDSCGSCGSLIDSCDSCGSCGSLIDLCDSYTHVAPSLTPVTHVPSSFASLTDSRDPAWPGIAGHRAAARAAGGAGAV